MPECLCPQCTPNPAPTYTESHRAACEARYVAKLTTHDDRTRYLGLVYEARGEAAYTRLRADAWKLLR